VKRVVRVATRSVVGARGEVDVHSVSLGSRHKKKVPPAKSDVCDARSLEISGRPYPGLQSMPTVSRTLSSVLEVRASSTSSKPCAMNRG
jgi:hypothetical protein